MKSGNVTLVITVRHPIITNLINYVILDVVTLYNLALAYKWNRIRRVVKGSVIYNTLYTTQTIAQPLNAF